MSITPFAFVCFALAAFCFVLGGIVCLVDREEDEVGVPDVHCDVPPEMRPR